MITGAKQYAVSFQDRNRDLFRFVATGAFAAVASGI